MNRERMDIVVVGHVDHGKSTIIGRLLADTGSLPKGKLEQVKENCKKSSRPFEYAFLLDALKDEQSQGITIDAARCFFKTKKRDYIIIDAPGHIEFLKNMITGASRAEAALLTIDAKEGIQENSKRHGHMISLLGIKQVVVLVNKLDLVDYSKEVFDNIQEEYTKFLDKLNVVPVSFIPVSAIYGDNIASKSGKTSWYKGPTVLEQMDLLTKKSVKEKQPFRFPVQDIYKFTAEGDDRRILAGTIESGSVKVGEEVMFLPSYKRSTIRSIEEFSAPVRDSAMIGEAVGFTLTEQIYAKPGEVMVKTGEEGAKVSARFKANIFWVAKAPMIKNKNYKLKLGSSKTTVRLVDIISVLDASELTSVKNKQQVERHDVAECILEATKPIAFDLASDIETMGRMVIVDNYEIAGGGIMLESLTEEGSILEEHIKERETQWEKSAVSDKEREAEFKHGAKVIVFTGCEEGLESKIREIAKELEKRLFNDKYKVYYFGLSNLLKGLSSDVVVAGTSREEQIRHIGELGRILTDSGQIFVTAIFDLDDYEVEKLKKLNEPKEIIVVNVGRNNFTKFKVSAELSNDEDLDKAFKEILSVLKKHDVIIEYYL